jgi:Flp pilus assembly protein protease CpaA
VEPLLAFAAALLALRLAGALARSWRVRRAPELAAWSAGLLAYALAAAAMAWGAAAGWNEPSFRLYYVCGGMLTAALLGVGSLLLNRRRWALPVGLVYAGLAVGLGIAAPLENPVGGSSIPDAGEHLALFPARIAAIVGNVAGTVAVVAVAASTIRRRPIGNALILAGVAVAAGGTAASGLGIAGTSLFVAAAAALLYLGFLRRS